MIIALPFGTHSYFDRISETLRSTKIISPSEKLTFLETKLYQGFFFSPTRAHTVTEEDSVHIQFLLSEKTFTEFSEILFI